MYYNKNNFACFFLRHSVDMLVAVDRMTKYMVPFDTIR